MPLRKGSSQDIISSNIRELHGGKTYAHTAEKFGKARANGYAYADWDEALMTAVRDDWAKLNGKPQEGAA